VLPIVIGDPRRGIGPALEHGWLGQAGTVQLPPVIMRRGTDVWSDRVDEERFMAYFGRRPLEGEMGCAAAHLQAYEELLASPNSWGLVLEDDAIVLDDSEFERVVRAVTKALEPTGRVVSLYSEGAIFPLSEKTVGSAVLLDLRVPPHGAVAYLIDRVAAADLLSAQRKIASVSDWPPDVHRVRFAFVLSQAIGHATDEVSSSVASGFDRRNAVPISVRLLMWTGIWFGLRRKEFETFGSYLNLIIIPRLARKFWRRL